MYYKNYLLIFIFSLLITACGSDTESNGSDNLDPINDSGNNSVLNNTLKSPVQKCVNLGAALEAPQGEDWGYDITSRYSADLQRIAEQGFDTVRLPVKWSDYTAAAPDYTVDSSIFTTVDAILSDAISKNLNIILDIHHFNEYSDDPRGEHDRLYKIWEQLSDHYQGWSQHLFFEVLNEPHFNDDYGSGNGIERSNQLNQEILNLIRTRGHPNRWVILGSSQWGSLGPLIEGDNGVFFDPPYDPNVITTFHYYSPADFTHQGFDGNPTGINWGSNADISALNDEISEAAVFRDAGGKGMPMFIGEFGTTVFTNSEDRASYFQKVREAAEDNGMGWCSWDFASPYFGMFDTSNDRWDSSLLDALIP